MIEEALTKGHENMAKAEGIKGNVAGILDDFTLVLNIGSENGVRSGMKFVIYELGETILDPGTQKELGKLELVKGFVEVINVQPNLCTVISSEMKTESLGIFSIQKVQRVALQIEERTMKVTQNQLKIKIGYLARQTI